MLHCQLGSHNGSDRANIQSDEPTLAPKRRSGALTNQYFIPPLGESKRSLKKDDKVALIHADLNG
jgi:hypothetical protein